MMLEILLALVSFLLLIGTVGGWAFIIHRLAAAYRRGTE